MAVNPFAEHVAKIAEKPAWDGHWPPPEDFGSYEVLEVLCQKIWSLQSIVMQLQNQMISLSNEVKLVNNHKHDVIQHSQPYIPPPVITLSEAKAV